MLSFQNCNEIHSKGLLYAPLALSNTQPELLTGIESALLEAAILTRADETLLLTSLLSQRKYFAF